MSAGGGQEKYSHEFKGWDEVFACNWSQKPSNPFKLAVGSFVEEYTNKIKIVTLDQEKNEFVEMKDSIEHPYPATKIMWIPDPTEKYEKDLLATTGDYLRLWNVTDHSCDLEQVLNNNKSSEFCAPLTSFDWCEANPKLIGTSSIDTTCTIWNIEVGVATATVKTPVTGEVKTQLIAHDQEVYDIAFMPSEEHSFCSVGADGSVRMFDLRSLKHSKIIYEDADTPLLRLCWNKTDNHYIATMKMGSPEVTILDIRNPCVPLVTLKGHGAKTVNGMAWAPNSGAHICTVGDDKQALIWDIGSGVAEKDLQPCLAYKVGDEGKDGGEINQIQWSSVSQEWIAICYNNILEVLRV